MNMIEFKGRTLDDVPFSQNSSSLPDYVMQWANKQYDFLTQTIHTYQSALAPTIRKRINTQLRSAIHVIASRLYTAASKQPIEPTANTETWARPRPLPEHILTQINTQQRAMGELARTSPKYQSLRKSIFRLKAAQNKKRFERLTDGDLRIQTPLLDMTALSRAIILDLTHARSKKILGSKKDPQYLLDDVLKQYKRVTLEDSVLVPLSPENSALLPPDFIPQKTYGEYHLFILNEKRHLAVESEVMNNCSEAYAEKTVPFDDCPESVLLSISLVLKKPRTISSVRGFTPIQENYTDSQRNEFMVRRKPLITIRYEPKTGLLAEIKAQNNGFVSSDPNNPLTPVLFEALADLAQELTRRYAKKGIISVGSDLQHCKPGPNLCRTITNEIKPVTELQKDDVVIASGIITPNADTTPEQIRRYLGFGNALIDLTDIKECSVQTVSAVYATKHIHCSIMYTGTDTLTLPHLQTIGGTIDSTEAALSTPRLFKVHGDAYFDSSPTVTTLSNIVFKGVAEFSHCTNLTNLSMCVFMNETNFKDCTQLQSMDVDTRFARSVSFVGCASLHSIPEEVLTFSTAKFYVDKPLYDKYHKKYPEKIFYQRP